MRCPRPRSAPRSKCWPATASKPSSSRDDGVTPTPVISRAILVYNRGRKEHLADGIVMFDLAEVVDLRGRIEAMFRGDKINVSEGRAVLHTALRAPKGASILVDKVARQDRAAHKLHQLAAATNRPPPLTHGDASS